MTDLSPAAREVIESVTLKQYNLPLERVPDLTVRKWSIAVSAALRAAAEVVAPISYEDVWTDGKWLQYEKQDEVRYKLLSITDELERAND